MSRKWYKGDTHLHTTNSDGLLSYNDLVAYCKRIGLDYMIVTDHNYNTVDQSHHDGDILVIQGQELTNKPGHINVWGKKVPHDPPHQLDTAEDYDYLVGLCKDAGATISLNHPFCSNCPFVLDMERYPFDCVEVWNTVQHTDNMKNRDWWVSQLLKGNRIGAVGGSDFHRDYLGVQFLAVPITYAYAEDNTEEAILSALREGRAVVTNSPRSSMIYLSYADAQVGDTAKLDDSVSARLAITKLKKGHRVLVYNNEEIVFDYTAPSNIPYFVTNVPVNNAGFIRAEITHKVKSVPKLFYSTVEKVFMSRRGVQMEKVDLPDFIWAFTNPIWIEK